MIAIRTVLCPVDFSPATSRQVDVAADVCRAFGARLVLHHNVNSMGTVAAVGWMWKADHWPPSPAEIDARLRSEIARAAAGLEADARATQGPSTRAVLAMCDAVGADLVVLSTHAAPSEDHASVTEQVLAEGTRAVLALHEAGTDRHTPRFASAAARQILLTPTDLGPESQAAIDWSFALARRLPVEVHLLHVLPHGSDRHAGSDAQVRQATDALRARVAADLESRVHLVVERGDPAHGILRAAGALGADCIVMGEHTRAPIRKWLSRDTSRGVLREAPCPVWYVPGRRAA
jgi:nucleotide-binding universal stress UspA family protein